MSYLIGRGVLVTVCQSLFLVLYATRPLHWEWAFFHVILSKLYTNTVCQCSLLSTSSHTL